MFVVSCCFEKSSNLHLLKKKLKLARGTSQGNTFAILLPHRILRVLESKIWRFIFLFQDLFFT